MTRDDYAYCAMRARQEDDAALLAACEAARQRHLELAEAYRSRCERIRCLFPSSMPAADGADQPMTARAPIASASSAALDTSPPTAARPLCRA